MPRPSASLLLLTLLFCHTLQAQPPQTSDPKNKADTDTDTEGYFVSDYQKSRSVRPLSDAIAEFNLAQAKDPVGKTQPPLTKEEILMALNYQHLINDMSEKLSELRDVVLDTQRLPPGAVLVFQSGTADTTAAAKSRIWVATLSFFLRDPALLVDKPEGSADKGYRTSVIVRANFHLR